jgi:23S rRNA (cytidine1920-2'-O)/16S rRNA (cytidine1409-2'-O)-methyltransferase
VRSRAEAQRLVRDGAVRVGADVVRKGAHPVTESDHLWVDADQVSRYVNRGAEKLAHAVHTWGLSVRGRRCLDVGASTGGFTQVLLEGGASEVVALDVGHGQLHPDVRADPRVTNCEGVSIRDVTRGQFGEPFDVVVADLSFISLRLVLKELGEQLAPGGWCVVLVKPQFEVGKERLARTGVVTSGQQRAEALTKVVAAATGQGMEIRGILKSPLKGGQGNVEYLLWLQSGPSGRMGVDELAATVARLGHDDQ